jgi:hypothetical protein
MSSNLNVLYVLLLFDCCDFFVTQEGRRLPAFTPPHACLELTVLLNDVMLSLIRMTHGEPATGSCLGKIAPAGKRRCFDVSLCLPLNTVSTLLIKSGNFQMYSFCKQRCALII